MMSETVRCSMCGAPNPADREECQECGARLKPLILHPQEEPSTPEAATGSPRPEPRSGGEAASPLGWVDASEEDLPQWLRELAGEEALGEEEEEPETGELLEEPDILGRLAGLREAEESPPTPPVEEEGLAAGEAGAADERLEEPRDWLGGLEEEPGVPEAAVPPSAEAFSPEAEEEALPDWWGGLEEAPTPSAEAAPPTAEEALPDWLSGPEEPPPAVAKPTRKEAPPASEEDLPDWLQGLEEAPEEAGETVVPPAVSTEEEGLPDWLGDVEAGAEPSEPQPSEREALPDWLSDVEAETPSATEPATSAESSATLDWLAEVEQEGEAPALPAVNPFDVAAPLDEEEGLPALGTGEAAEEEAALPAVPGTGEEEFALDDLPDWLDSLAPEALVGIEEEASPGGEEGAGDLAPGQLPDWLEAIRPEEVALEGLPLEVEEEEPEVVETKGPLAGLSGVLPAETLPRPRKTGAAAARLTLREEEARYAEILRAMLAEEKQVTPPSQRWRWLPQRLLRVALALVLLLVAWLPSVFGGLVPPLPEGIPPEVMAANRIVSQLPDQPVVLLAVDYNPAWRAEMESAAAPLVDHLMVRGARLAMISTQPMGPALAEHFLHGPLAEHGYVEGQQYVNLGYLSGGMAALQHLALSPVDAAPWSINGYPAWEAAPLAGIRQMNDFDLVVVSDDPDVARVWVEQVQPRLPTTPLILVISAQAEPLVRPYYESQPSQVQGLVTGLMGGLAYMRLTGRLGEGVQYWGGFTWGVWAAILLLFLGGVYNLILGLRARRQAHG